jgi:hypothetical protein
MARGLFEALRQMSEIQGRAFRRSRVLIFKKDGLKKYDLI